MKSQKKQEQKSKPEKSRSENRADEFYFEENSKPENDGRISDENDSANFSIRDFSFAKLDYVWLAGCFFITATAAFLRFWQLELKPLHHDEGVNGHFLTTLFRTDVYKYDPSNYHGPDLYYVALAFTKIFGLNTISIRSSVAVFGVLIVILAFFFKNYIGKTGSLAAGLFLALSPGMVYVSRYFIHEMMFAFFSLAIVLAILLFIKRQKVGIFAVGWMILILFVCFLPSALNLAARIGGEDQMRLWILRGAFFLVEGVLVFYIIRMLLDWDAGRPIYLLLASAAIVMLFATKETAFITVGTMAIACVAVWLWRKIYQAVGWNIKENDLEPPNLTWKNFRAKLGDNANLLLLAAAASAMFIYLGALFFSSFFTYPEGVKSAFTAYAFWTKTGGKDHTGNGFFAYLKWLMKIESPIVILAAVGSLFALAKARHRFAIFAAFWSLGIFTAYTLIPYKTPWLALSIILPMCLIAGYGINELARSGDVMQKITAAILAAVAALTLGYQSYELNFVRYDDEKEPYVYAHTRREFLQMIDKMKYYAAKSEKGNEATITVVSPDYWSMPWYLNDFPHAEFFGIMTDVNASEMIVAKKDAQDAEISEKFSAHYKIAGTYPLRPGVDLYLLVRRDIADADAREIDDAINE